MHQLLHYRCATFKLPGSFSLLQPQVVSSLTSEQLPGSNNVFALTHSTPSLSLEFNAPIGKLSPEAATLIRLISSDGCASTSWLYPGFVASGVKGWSAASTAAGGGSSCPPTRGRRRRKARQHRGDGEKDAYREGVGSPGSRNQGGIRAFGLFFLSSRFEMG